MSTSERLSRLEIRFLEIPPADIIEEIRALIAIKKEAEALERQIRKRTQPLEKAV